MIDAEQSVRYSLAVGLRTDDCHISNASTGRKGLATANQSVEQLVADGKPRQDFYYRINCRVIELPTH